MNTTIKKLRRLTKKEYMYKERQTKARPNMANEGGTPQIKTLG